MIDKLQGDLKKLIELMGFKDFSLSYDDASSRISVFIEDREISEKSLSGFVADLDRLVKLMVKKMGSEGSIFVDVNNYRRERENIILEIARGAARKAVATKQEIALPVMNAYERRLIHTELASRPDIKTESVGDGKERYVVVKPITE